MTNYTPVNLNINTLTVGDDWRYSFEVVDIQDNPFDWTGFTGAQIQVKDYQGNLITDFTGPEITLTTGFVTLTKTRTLTANLTPGAYEYDLEIIDNNAELKTLIYGNFTILKQITI